LALLVLWRCYVRHRGEVGYVTVWRDDFFFFHNFRTSSIMTWFLALLGPFEWQKPARVPRLLARVLVLSHFPGLARNGLPRSCFPELFPVSQLARLHNCHFQMAPMLRFPQSIQSPVGDVFSCRLVALGDALSMTPCMPPGFIFKVRSVAISIRRRKRTLLIGDLPLRGFLRDDLACGSPLLEKFSHTHGSRFNSRCEREGG